MFKITESAQEQILARMESEGKSDSSLRVRIIGWTAEDFEYRLEVIPAEQTAEGDVQVADGELPVWLAADSADRLQGATLDFVEQAHARGFSIENPNPVWTDETSLAVQRVLDKEINPGVGMHGGRVRLLEVRDDVAYIQFDGGCVGCGMSNVTLKQGVDQAIRQHVPQIREIVDSTNHAAGTNPYYKPEETEGAHSPVA